ncbi:MAG: hypothetical protein AB2806_08750 [Candidatus Thiodiazotropha sp.]
MERTHQKSTRNDRFSFSDFMIAMALSWAAAVAAFFWITAWLAS